MRVSYIVRCRCRFGVRVVFVLGLSLELRIMFGLVLWLGFRLD